MKKTYSIAKPLWVYFSLAYLTSWIIWLPLYAPALGLKNLPVLPFHHGIGALGPLIASLVCTWIFEGEEGLRILIGQVFRIRPLVYLGIALLSPFLLAAIASGMAYRVNGNPFDLSALLTTREFPGFTFADFLFYNLLFFGFGEEMGWRGFALPRLQLKYNALVSSVVLTLFWAVWHWPLFLYRPGFMEMGWAGTAGWLFSLLTGSVLLSWLYNASKGSLLVCAVFHSTVDIAFTADFANPNITNYMGMLITIGGIAILAVFKAGHLSPSGRVSWQVLPSLRNTEEEKKKTA